MQFRPTFSMLFALSCLLLNPFMAASQDKNVQQEIIEHGAFIRAAFATADIDKIESLHHPEVIKALGYDDLKVGIEEVIDGLEGTLENYELEFIENDIESILVRNDLAIEQTKFSIRGTPRNEGEPFVFSGRTMVTYVRYEHSPTGWATIREIIQPAPQ